MAVDPAPIRAAGLRRAALIASLALALPLSAAAMADAHATRDAGSHRHHHRHAHHHRLHWHDAEMSVRSDDDSVTTSTDDVATPVATPDDSAMPVATPDDSATPVATPDDSATPVATPDDSATPVATPDDSATPVATVEDNPTPGADDAATPTPTPATDDSASTSAWWQPALGLSWQWQLTGDIDTSVDADVYDLDLFDTDAATVDALHAAGRKVVCYFSAGSSEDWRPDFAAFPASVQGKGLDGWPGEKWLDVRALDTLLPIMRARLDECKSKGFDGVEADNVDGYANDNGFGLTADDQLAYIRALASAAHERGLAYGLKNDLDQVADLVGDTDFAVNEQCHEYGECDLLAPYVAAGKPVFNAEYGKKSAATCSASATLGLSTIFKSLDLDAARETC